MKKYPQSYMAIPAAVFVSSNASLYFSLTDRGLLNSLTMPSFAPPEWFVIIAWQLMNILAAVAAVYAWETLKHSQRFKAIMICLASAAALDAVFSYSIYRLHIISRAPWELALVTLLIWAAFSLLWHPLRSAAYLLIPMAFWMTFRTYLFWSIAQLNESINMIQFFKS